MVGAHHFTSFSPYHTHLTPVSRWSVPVSHSHHHPRITSRNGRQGHADRRPPCADDQRVEWPSSELPTAGSPSPIIAWQDEMHVPL